MATDVTVLDLKGLKCPQPTLKMTIEMTKIPKGNKMEAVADCDTFEDDVRNWCKRTKKTLLWIKREDNGVMRCQIQL